MLGKLIDGRLVVAGRIVKEGNTTITNPTNEKLVELGYKEIQYTEKPKYDVEEEKLVEEYINGNNIVVNYTKVALTEEEQFEIKKQKVICLEQQYKMYRWQREIILNENSGASEYTKQKAQEIEELAKELR